MTTKYIQDITTLANHGNYETDQSKIEYLAYVHTMPAKFIKREVVDLLRRRLKYAQETAEILMTRIEKLD